MEVNEMLLILALLTPTFLLGQAVGTSVARPPQPGTTATTPTPAPELKPEERCTIEGQVVDAITGEPVKRASLILRRADMSSMTFSVATSYTTSSDVAGKFAMKDIDPGKYQLTVSRNGFAPLSYGARGPGRSGTTLSLARAQQVKEIVLRMTPHGVVTGRVLDHEGEPVAYAQVQAMRYRYMQGRKQLVPSGSGATNDLGEYRLFGLAPGKYYLSATARGMMMYEPSVDRSAAAQPEEEFVATYYPGTVDPASAALVDVVAGNPVRGLDFTLSRIRTVRIKGRVTGASGPRPPMLMLIPRDRGSFMGPNRANASDPAGNFDLRGVAPGAYYLVATVYDGERTASGKISVDVGSSNLENVIVAIGSGVELVGRVRVEGDAPISLANVRIMLRPYDPTVMMFGGVPDGRINEDGTFTLSRVNPDHYNFTLMGLPDGFYLKAARSGDQDVLLPGLDLARGPAGPIDLVLSPNAGKVEGVAQNDDKPAAGATIVLIPQQEQLRDRMEAVKTVTSDQYGHFSLKNVQPGKYKAYAWEDIEYGAYMDPDVLKQAEGKAESVTVREETTENLQLKLVPAEGAGQGTARTGG